MRTHGWPWWRSPETGADASSLRWPRSPTSRSSTSRCPGIGGLETTRLLLAQLPAMKVVVLSGDSDGSAASAAEAAGATRFLFKGGLHEEIANAIVDAHGARLAAQAIETGAQTLAPVRQPRCAVTLAAQHRVGRPRRGTAELRGRDPAHTTVETRLLEDRLGEVRPRAVAVGRDVPDAARQVDELSNRRREVTRRTSGEPRWSSTTATSSRSAPRREHRAAGSCGSSSRRATTCARSRRPRPPRPLPCSFVRPYADCGLGGSDSTYGVALPAVEDVVGREGDERSTELGRVLRPSDVDGRRAPAARSRRRRRPSRRPRAARGRPARARGGGKVTSHSARVSARTSSPANSSTSAVPSWPPAPVTTMRRVPTAPAMSCSRDGGRARHPTGCRARPDRPGRTPR